MEEKQSAIRHAGTDRGRQHTLECVDDACTGRHGRMDVGDVSVEGDE